VIFIKNISKRLINANLEILRYLLFHIQGFFITHLTHLARP